MIIYIPRDPDHKKASSLPIASFESFLLEVILRPWPSEFFIPDPVFAARTEITVWQDYHLSKLLTQISISRSYKQFISSYIKDKVWA